MCIHVSNATGCPVSRNEASSIHDGSCDIVSVFLVTRRLSGRPEFQHFEGAIAILSMIANTHNV